jgi:hypothetical protein
MYKPSFYAHIINGILIFVALFIMYKNYSKITKLPPYNIIILVLFFSICIGLHGISHMGLETIYDYNPFVPI